MKFRLAFPVNTTLKIVVKGILEELVLNVENQFLDDTFDRDSVHSSTSKSESKSEYDTEYEPDNSFQLDQSTCLSDDQFSEQEHLKEQLPPCNNWL